MRCCVLAVLAIGGEGERDTRKRLGGGPCPRVGLVDGRVLLSQAWRQSRRRDRVVALSAKRSYASSSNLISIDHKRHAEPWTEYSAGDAIDTMLSPKVVCVPISNKPGDHDNSVFSARFSGQATSLIDFESQAVRVTDAQTSSDSEPGDYDDESTDEELVKPYDEVQSSIPMDADLCQF